MGIGFCMGMMTGVVLMFVAGLIVFEASVWKEIDGYLADKLHRKFYYKGGSR